MLRKVDTRKVPFANIGKELEIIYYNGCDYNFKEFRTACWNKKRIVSLEPYE